MTRRRLLFRRVPPPFERRSVTIVPGDALSYEPSRWCDAIVQVESGSVELECARGLRRRFERGDVVWLDGLSVLALHNPGSVPVVLVAVSRPRR